MDAIQPPEVLPTTKIAHPLDGVRLLAQLMDRAFVLPGTNIRFGLDSIIGLFPGLGDAVSSLIGLYILSVATQLGVPKSVLYRMVMNQGVDAALGLVPVVGDVADVAFKAHTRNVALLEQAVADPKGTGRKSWAVFAGLAVVLLAIVAGTIALGVFLAGLLAKAVS